MRKCQVQLFTTLILVIEMKRNQLIALLMFLVNAIYAQNIDFRTRPWLKEYAIVLDAYRLNDINYTKLNEETKVKAIIFKACDGKNVDVKYHESKKIAKSNGYLVASYHLGRKGDPVGQADFYLAQIADGINEPMALDIEKIGGNNISLSDAILFVNRIFEKTGKYPMIYMNNAVFEAINSKYDRKSVFAKCDLWYARFREVLPPLSTKIWDKVTLWQFACEINCQVCLETDVDKKCIKRAPKYTENCPLKVKGTLYDMDVNAFNGDLEQLKTFWQK